MFAKNVLLMAVSAVQVLVPVPFVMSQDNISWIIKFANYVPYQVDLNAKTCLYVRLVTKTKVAF